MCRKGTQRNQANCRSLEKSLPHVSNEVVPMTRERRSHHWLNHEFNSSRSTPQQKVLKSHKNYTKPSCEEFLMVPLKRSSMRNFRLTSIEFVFASQLSVTGFKSRILKWFRQPCRIPFKHQDTVAPCEIKDASLKKIWQTSMMKHYETAFLKKNINFSQLLIIFNILQELIVKHQNISYQLASR